MPPTAAAIEQTEVGHEAGARLVESFDGLGLGFNGAVLRYRDPIYRSLRELALSYFHEYCSKRGHKTLRSYSTAFDLRRIDPALWVTRDHSCLEVNSRLAAARHYSLLSRRQEKLLSRRDAFEQRAAKMVEYPKPLPRKR